LGVEVRRSSQGSGCAVKMALRGYAARLMAEVDPFHSSGRAHLDKRAHGHYHVESKCQFGERVKFRGFDTPGTGGYRLCKRCSVLMAKRETRSN